MSGHVWMSPSLLDIWLDVQTSAECPDNKADGLMYPDICQVAKYVVYVCYSGCMFNLVSRCLDVSGHVAGLQTHVHMSQWVSK